MVLWEENERTAEVKAYNFLGPSGTAEQAVEKLFVTAKMSISGSSHESFDGTYGAD